MFLTLGLTTGVAALLRFASWSDESSSRSVPEGLWVLGPLSLAFLLVAAQLYLPVRARQLEAQREKTTATQDRDDWVDQ